MIIYDLGDIKKAVSFKTNGISNCLELCKLILRKYGITTYGSSTNVFKLMYEDKGELKHYGDNIKENYKNATECIDRHLAAGRPIIVGVNYILNRGINEGATDHFVVIYGKGFDETIKKYYYTYYEVGRSSLSDVYNDKNRFIFEDGKVPYLYDMESGLRGNARFDITQVRPNDGNLEKTIPQNAK
jgi:hypothetical protein